MADESPRAYPREVRSDHVPIPPMSEWLRRARALGPADLSGPTGPGLVAASRARTTSASAVDHRRHRRRNSGGLDLRLPGGRPFRRVIAATAVAAPAHRDAEVLAALARLVREGRLPREQDRVGLLAAFAAKRWPLQPLLLPAWTLLEGIAARDALYVALAVSLDAILVTTDGRLRGAASGLVAVAEPARTADRA